MSLEDLLLRLRRRLHLSGSADDALLCDLLADAHALMLAYTGRDTLPPALTGVQCQLAAILYNRLGMEGEDYVIEDELPRIRALAAANGAALYYIVLTADAAEIEARIRRRGDTDMIGRALFLKDKLEAMPENRGHLIDNTGRDAEEIIRRLELDRYLVP